jgi:hypothetical protein
LIHTPYVLYSPDILPTPLCHDGNSEAHSRNLYFSQ